MPKKMFKININKIREQDKNEKEKKMEDIKSQELNTFEKNNCFKRRKNYKYFS